jgi:hypothetical protein
MSTPCSSATLLRANARSGAVAPRRDVVWSSSAYQDACHQEQQLLTCRTCYGFQQRRQLPAAALQQQEHDDVVPSNVLEGAGAAARPGSRDVARSSTAQQRRRCVGVLEPWRPGREPARRRPEQQRCPAAAAGLSSKTRGEEHASLEMASS